MLNPAVFRAIDQKWGPLQIDLFASKWNKQLPRCERSLDRQYVSDLGGQARVVCVSPVCPHPARSAEDICRAGRRGDDSAFLDSTSVVAHSFENVDSLPGVPATPA